MLCKFLVLFLRLVNAYGSACFDDWACFLLLCCNEFLLVALTKLGLLLISALCAFCMESVNFCFRFLFLGFESGISIRVCRSKGMFLGSKCLCQEALPLCFLRKVGVGASRQKL